MPWMKRDQIPGPLREQIEPGEETEQFLAVFNERLGAGDSESSAIAKALSAVDNNAGELDQWITIYPPVMTLHPDATGGAFDPAEFGEEMVESFEHFRDEYGYFPPIMVDHGEDREGQIGLVKAMRYTPDEGVQVKPHFTPGAKEDWKAGKIVYFSPTHDENLTDPHTGDELGYALTELSAMKRERPNIKAQGVQNPYYDVESGFVSLSNHQQETIMDDEKSNQEDAPQTDEESSDVSGEVDNEATSDLSRLAEAVDGFQEKLDGALERIEAIEQKLDETEESEPEEGDVSDEEGDDEGAEVGNSEKKRLEEKVRRLEERAIRSELQNRGLDDPDEGLVDTLVGLDEGGQRAVIKNLETGGDEVQNGGDVVEHGEVGNASPGGKQKVDWEQATKIMDEEGITRGRTQYAQERWPHLELE